MKMDPKIRAALAERHLEADFDRQMDAWRARLAAELGAFTSPREIARKADLAGDVVALAVLWRAIPQEATEASRAQILATVETFSGEGDFPARRHVRMLLDFLGELMPLPDPAPTV
jgi:hypothetical protein